MARRSSSACCWCSWGCAADHYCFVAGAQRSRHPAYYVYLGIELQRISLGALIIALSMLVDNAIVIVEGVLIARQQGSPLLGAINYVIRPPCRCSAPRSSPSSPSRQLASQDSTGEYCKSLFRAADLPDAQLVFRPDHHAGTHQVVVV